MIGQVPAGASPGITVRSSDIGKGAFDFAVAAISGGSASSLCASFDATADPVGGWYLIWY